MLGSLVAVYAAFGIRFVGPMLALPYLCNTLSPEVLAIYLAVQSIGLMGGAGIEYGFGGWASRELAGAQAASRVATIASGVLTAQALLISIVFPSVMIAAVLTPGISGNIFAVFAIGGFAVISGISPTWYFQGLQRASKGALIECAAAMISLGSLFLFVRSSTDLPQAMASMALGPGLAYGIGLAQVVRETRLSRLRLGLGWRYICSAFTMFSIRAAILIYTSASTWMMFVLGDPIGTTQYGIANRLAVPILALYGPLTQVLLPSLHRRVTNSGALTLREGLTFVALLEASAGVAIITCHLLSRFVTSHILMITIPGVPEAVNGLSWVLLPVATSQALVLYFILPYKKESWNLISILAGAAAFVVAALLLVPRYSVSGMIFARLVGESSVSFGLIIGSIFLWRGLRVRVGQA